MYIVSPSSSGRKKVAMQEYTRWSSLTDDGFVCDALTGDGGGQAGNGGWEDEGLFEHQWLGRRVQ